ncbi:DUF4185 domain-containing protein [Streptosporangium sp. KLBMP 9127]|nr:DUF4185 domain-containing protein [Streptosporangium sp. KLBMP 9127]
MSRARYALIPLLAGLLGAGALPPAALAAPPRPAPVTASPQATTSAKPACDIPEFQGATTNTRLTNLFTAYGDDNGRLDDWTGADGTYSLTLANGRRLWVFSDTFLGQVNPDGSRPPVKEEGGTTAFINNSFAVERNGRLSTIHGGTAEDPKAVMPPRDDKHWYWAGDAVLAGGLVEVTYQEYERFGAGQWDWRWSRNVVARFPTGRLTSPVSVHPLPSGKSVAWASGFHRAGSHTYIYGVEDLGGTKYMHIARVNGKSLLGQWEYYTAAGAWSTAEADSARVMPGVANEYSVSKVGGSYVLITHDTTETLSPRIVAYHSCTPYGPFTAKTQVYTTPEAATYGPNIFTYNAHAHPGIDADGKLVVSYNVNSFVNTDHYKDVTIYRPRFIDLSFR